MACKNFNMTIQEKNTVDEVPIIMVDRGNCSFVTKVRNVQEAGGHLALIVNNNPYENIEDIFMADDGKGRDLVIPGIMITYKEGEILKNFYRKNKNNQDVLNSILLEVDFEMENRTNIVKLDFFVDSKSEKFYEVLNDLNSHLVNLKDFIDLNVYYISHFSYENKFNNNIGILSSLKNVENCYSSGRQCHPTSGKFGVFDGRVFLDEDINQKCILNYSKENKDIEIYLNYMNNFYKNCVNSTNFFTNNVKSTNFNSDCSEKVMLENKIPKDKISYCYYNSFNITEQIKAKINKNNIDILNNKEIDEVKIYAENILLEKDRRKKLDNLISFLPSINVNNRNFWGSWTKENIIEDICASFLKKPQICYDEGYFKNDDTGYSFKSMFILYLVIIITNLIIFLICKKMIRRNIVERIESTDINHKINTVVTSYLALRDNK